MQSLLAGLAVPATAGHKSPGYGVNVNLAGRSASGTIGATHNSSNTVESIYCSVSGYDTWTAVGCAAVNAANVFAACNITNPPRSMLDALASLGLFPAVYLAGAVPLICAALSSPSAACH